jgi:hypothetical protein
MVQFNFGLKLLQSFCLQHSVKAVFPIPLKPSKSREKNFQSSDFLYFYKTISQKFTKLCHENLPKGNATALTLISSQNVQKCLDTLLGCKWLRTLICLAWNFCFAQKPFSSLGEYCIGHLKRFFVRSYLHMINC